MDPLSPSRLFGELAKYQDIFSRILDDRSLSMEDFTKTHTQTITDYQLRYLAHPLEFKRAQTVTQDLWLYMQDLYSGYGPLITAASQADNGVTPAPKEGQSLINLIYVSTATEPLSNAELEKILDSSIRHNTPQSVTGMLLYTSGSFMQVLEGDEAAVEETFSRILEDPRHASIILLHRGPIAARSFQDWTMGFRRLGPHDAVDNPEYAPCFRDGFDARRINKTSGMALDMLLQFGHHGVPPVSPH